MYIIVCLFGFFFWYITKTGADLKSHYYFLSFESLSFSSYAPYSISGLTILENQQINKY